MRIMRKFNKLDAALYSAELREIRLSSLLPAFLQVLVIKAGSLLGGLQDRVFNERVLMVLRLI
jgi:hypothetical protein